MNFLQSALPQIKTELDYRKIMSRSLTQSLSGKYKIISSGLTGTSPLLYKQVVQALKIPFIFYPLFSDVLNKKKNCGHNFSAAKTLKTA